MPNAFVRIGTDERITVIVNHSEMGQGVYTSLPMLLAEELDADGSKVGFESAPVDPKVQPSRFRHADDRRQLQRVVGLRAISPGRRRCPRHASRGRGAAMECRNHLLPHRVRRSLRCPTFPIANSPMANWWRMR